jgi:REP element-mobilizing transposase RayT
MTEPKRKRIRLDAEVYRTEGRTFSVTVRTLFREPVFEDQEFGLDCVRILRDLRSESESSIYAYCLMPDHFHLLIGLGRAMALPDLVGRYKSLCYHARCHRNNKNRFWQRGYFDHAIRQMEDLRAAARYILLNPVRKGLVEHYRQYPLCGSLEWDLE